MKAELVIIICIIVMATATSSQGAGKKQPKLKMPKFSLPNWMKSSRNKGDLASASHQSRKPSIQKKQNKIPSTEIESANPGKTRAAGHHVNRSVRPRTRKVKKVPNPAQGKSEPKIEEPNNIASHSLEDKDDRTLRKPDNANVGEIVESNSQSIEPSAHLGTKSHLPEDLGPTKPIGDNVHVHPVDSVHQGVDGPSQDGHPLDRQDKAGFVNSAPNTVTSPTLNAPSLESKTAHSDLEVSGQSLPENIVDPHQTHILSKHNFNSESLNPSNNKIESDGNVNKEKPFEAKEAPVGTSTKDMSIEKDANEKINSLKDLDKISDSKGMPRLEDLTNTWSKEFNGIIGADKKFEPTEVHAHSSLENGKIDIKDKESLSKEDKSNVEHGSNKPEDVLQQDFGADKIAHEDSIKQAEHLLAHESHDKAASIKTGTNQLPHKTEKLDETDKNSESLLTKSADSSVPHVNAPHMQKSFESSHPDTYRHSSSMIKPSPQSLDTKIEAIPRQEDVKLDDRISLYSNELTGLKTRLKDSESRMQKLNQCIQEKKNYDDAKQELDEAQAEYNELLAKSQSQVAVEEQLRRINEEILDEQAKTVELCQKILEYDKESLSKCEQNLLEIRKRMDHHKNEIGKIEKNMVDLIKENEIPSAKGVDRETSSVTVKEDTKQNEASDPHKDKNDDKAAGSQIGAHVETFDGNFEGNLNFDKTYRFASGQLDNKGDTLKILKEGPSQQPEIHNYETSPPQQSKVISASESHADSSKHEIHHKDFERVQTANDGKAHPVELNTPEKGHDILHTSLSSTVDTVQKKPEIDQIIGYLRRFLLPHKFRHGQEDLAEKYETLAKKVREQLEVMDNLKKPGGANGQAHEEQTKAIYKELEKLYEEMVEQHPGEI